jgi:exodeoxyribonuclease VII large subunit
MAREQKTPTKVAAVFVDHNFATENKLVDLYVKFYGLINYKIKQSKDKLEILKPNVFKMADREIKSQRTKLITLKSNAFKSVDNNIKNGMRHLSESKLNVFKKVDSLIKNETDKLNTAKKTTKLLDPQLILNRGFAIVTYNDRVVTDSTEIEGGMEIQARLKNGIIYSKVTRK